MIRNFLVVICLGHGLKTTVQSLNIPFTATPLNVLTKPKEDSSLPNINDESTLTAAPTLFDPKARTVSSKLQNAWDEKKHPLEEPNELGNGIFLTDDWRKAWYSYDMKLQENGSEQERGTKSIDSSTGYANYVIDEIDGTLPDDLVGTLYRNGPGKMGINGQRVAHALDGDGLVLQITFSPPNPDSSSGQREVKFQSRFVQTKHFTEELNANSFVLRGTFGTGPLGTDPGP
jgi:Retinal pigment epithelial membrane protein